MGRIRRPGRRLIVDTGWDDLRPGESVSVNGVCLTVVSAPGGAAAFDVVRETMSRTNLGDLRRGDFVNLERALRVGDRLSGHIVQGHVDGTGIVRRTGAILGVESPLSRQMVTKGSVAINGVSLTVVDVEPDYFTIALIPTTLRITNLGRLRRGRRVNIELDILAKYVRRASRITKDWLRRAGF